VQHALVLANNDGADLHPSGRFGAGFRQRAQQTRRRGAEATVSLLLKPIGEGAGEEVLGKTTWRDDRNCCSSTRERSLSLGRRLILSN
jgi:hypothetical protein